MVSTKPRRVGWKGALMTLFMVVLGAYLRLAAGVPSTWSDWCFVFPMGWLSIWALWSCTKISEATSKVRDDDVDDLPTSLPEYVAGKFLPPSFAALGILFTFLGLLHGLDGFDTRSDGLLDSIEKLMGGTETAFLSSIFGVGLQVITGYSFQQLWENYEAARQDVLFQRYLKNDEPIPEILVATQPQLAMITLVRENRAQKKSLEKLESKILELIPDATKSDVGGQGAPNITVASVDHQLNSTRSEGEDASSATNLQPSWRIVPEQLARIIELLEASNHIEDLPNTLIEVTQRQVEITKLQQELSTMLENLQEDQADSVLQIIRNTLHQLQLAQGKQSEIAQSVADTRTAFQGLHRDILTLRDALESHEEDE